MDQAALLAWFSQNGRDLPWRRTRDPYAIWVSEAMCQQTQVATVLPYFERWMWRFPTVEALASSTEEDALALWSGLGYYRRCRMLWMAARIVARDGWPTSARAWRRLPGVGDYTAAAIASITLAEPVAVVDGNVERVFARYTGSNLTGAALRRASWEWASQVLVSSNPGDWNQAMMELGALVCTPRRPRCEACPLARSCASLAEGNFERPRKPTKEMIEVEHHVWAIHREGQLAVGLRAEGDWWAGLYAFPITESRTPPVVAESVRPLTSFRHVVTRHRIQMHAWLIDGPCPDGFAWKDPDVLESLAMPAPQRRVLELAVRALAAT